MNQPPAVQQQPTGCFLFGGFHIAQVCRACEPQAAAAASACGWFVEEGDWRGEVPMGDRRGEVRGLSHVLLRARTKPTAELTRGDAVELDLLKAGEAEGEECC